MAEVSSDVSDIRRPPEDYNPTRLLMERFGPQSRGHAIIDHDRARLAPEQPVPAGREADNGELAGGFQPTQTNTENISHQSAESADGEEGARARLAAAREELQRTKQIYQETPKNSPLSFRRWQEFCQARTNLGLAEIAVGTSRIADAQAPSELDPGLIADWETVFDGRI